MNKKEKLIIYTNENCNYCNQLKEVFEKEGVEFIEKLTNKPEDEEQVYNKEWHRVMYATGTGITPTILFKDNYFVPGRDFASPNQLLEILNKFETPTMSNEELILERIKTLNHNIANALTSLNVALRDMGGRLYEKEKGEENGN